MFIGKTDTDICLIATLVQYLKTRPNQAGSLLIWQDSSVTWVFCFWQLNQATRIWQRMLKLLSSWQGSTGAVGGCRMIISGLPLHWHNARIIGWKRE